MFLILNIGILFLSGKSFHFFLFFVILVSGVCLLCIRIFLNWVCWVRGNFSGEPGHVYISCAYLSSVWSGGPVQFYLDTSVVWAAGLYGFSFLSGPAVAGTAWQNWRGGVIRFPFAFLSLLSVLLAVGSLW
jgi:hypothetical protein